MDEKEKDRFYSFEKALRELRLKEEELKRLVSEGEIRAFRDEDKMKFRREDIERLKGKGGSIDFSKEASDASADTLADDLVFEEEEELSLSGEAGMQTAPISEETLADEDEGMATQPVEKSEPRASSRPGARPTAAPARRTTGTVTSRTTTRVRETAPAGPKGSGLMTAVLVLCSVVLFFGIFVAIDLFKDQKGGMTSGVVNFFGENFASK